MKAKAKRLRLTVREAAELLGVHYQTVHRMIAEGELKASAPKGRGRGKRLYLNPDAVKRYARKVK